MPTNPVSDTYNFLIGNTSDYLAIGPGRYVLVVLFGALILASIALAAYNWANDPEQRTAKHLATWLMRATMAGLWAQGCLWKLPLPVNDGFKFWTSELAKYSVIPGEPWIVNNILLPALPGLQAFSFTVELAFAAALLLGFAVRFFGIAAALWTAHLWLGLYNDPTEWAWTYWGIIGAHAMFALDEAGRSLGLDNLLRTRWDGARHRPSALRRAYRLAS